MRRRLSGHGAAGGLHDGAILRSAGGSLLASLIMGLCLWVVSSAMPDAGWTLAVVGGMIAVIVFFSVSYIFNLSENAGAGGADCSTTDLIAKIHGGISTYG